ncbi:hypothetical protein N665_1087s0003 [Sinapis alba]|nr:hypothetical protein N665_1087s0003 [Sinapis alba]
MGSFRCPLSLLIYMMLSISYLQTENENLLSSTPDYDDEAKQESCHLLHRRYRAVKTRFSSPSILSSKTKRQITDFLRQQFQCHVLQRNFLRSTGSQVTFSADSFLGGFIH